MILTTVDTAPRRCINTEPVSFKTGLEPTAVFDMIEYINNATDGMWIVGISCGSVSQYLLPAYEYFSQVLGVDLSILAQNGKISFIARKGDPFAAEQRTFVDSKRSVLMEADLKLGHGSNLVLNHT